MPGVPTPTVRSVGFHYAFRHRLVDLSASLRSAISSASSSRCASSARRSAPILSAIRDNPLRAAAVGHNVHGYKLTAFVIAAAYAGFAGGLLGVLQAFMPPDAFIFDTSGQLVMQTAIGGAGTLFGPLLGAAVWLFLQRLPAGALGLGAAWKLVLGVVFVLLVCFLRRGLIGGIKDLYGLAARRRARSAPMPRPPRTAAPAWPRRRAVGSADAGAAPRGRRDSRARSCRPPA